MSAIPIPSLSPWYDGTRHATPEVFTYGSDLLGFGRSGGLTAG
jgi:hypothetical protein